MFNDLERREAYCLKLSDRVESLSRKCDMEAIALQSDHACRLCLLNRIHGERFHPGYGRWLDV